MTEPKITREQIEQMRGDAEFIGNNIVVAIFTLALQALAMQPRPIAEAPKDGTVILTDYGTARWSKSRNRWYLCTTSGSIPSCADWGREVSEVEPSIWWPLPTILEPRT